MVGRWRYRPRLLPDLFSIPALGFFKTFVPWAVKGMSVGHGRRRISLFLVEAGHRRQGPSSRWA
jgi:hypothetical protein